jgi:hypothetical protein
MDPTDPDPEHWIRKGRTNKYFLQKVDFRLPVFAERNLVSLLSL